MASRGLWHFMSARTRRSLALSWSALFVLSLLLQYFSFAVVTPAALAVNSSANKLLGGFEIDGDFPSGTMTTPGDDWSNGTPGSGLVNGPSVRDPFGNADGTVLSNGVSDGDPVTDWQMNGSAGAPQKADMGNVYVATRPQPQPPTPSSHFYTYIGIERAASTGTVQYDLEFNHLGNRTNSHGVVVPNRSTGDLLFTGTQQGGGSWTIQGTVQKWTGTWNSGSWSAPTLIADSIFYGLANEFDATHPASWPDALGSTVPSNQFAEMAIDVSAAIPAAVGCPGFGTLNVRSISSTGNTPELKDVTAGIPIDVSNCASLSWQKEDDAGHHLGGATFTVDPNPFTGTGAAVDFTDYVSTSAQSDPTQDQDKRAGYFSLINVVPGTYTVTEKTAPTGYIK
ncbi:MAG TPA: prealbumin-like fold domain-containing protein, partial [Candidatus Bathyarchaeia archaeon]|nr:prealbumin-like fold domain-containing protein [Candidatus Bathyarchaeia archaeon]